MRNATVRIILVSSLCFFTSGVFAAAPMKPADEPVEQSAEAKKKKAGEECKSSADCQRHHACLKTDAKSICTPIPEKIIPPT